MCSYEEILNKTKQKIAEMSNDTQNKETINLRNTEEEGLMTIRRLLAGFQVGGADASGAEY